MRLKFQTFFGPPARSPHIGNGTKGQGSGNKLDQLPNQQVVGADGKTIPIYDVKPNGPYATQEFPSTPVAHGFPDIVDNYANINPNSPLFNVPDLSRQGTFRTFTPGAKP